MNRIAVTTAVTIVSAAAVVALAAQPGDAATHKRVHTATYILPQSTARSTFVGADEKHPAIGDRYVESYQIRRHGRTIGHAYNSCTLVAGHSENNSVGQCVTTFVLPHGQVTSIGRPSNAATSQIPLAGGSGRYAYITGTATTTFKSGAATLTLRYVRTR
jgi:hypothetical protein